MVVSFQIEISPIQGLFCAYLYNITKKFLKILSSFRTHFVVYNA